MLKIVPKSNESIIGEEHLYTIMFGLEDVLKLYEKELKELDKTDYYFQKRYENKIYETKKLLEEINEAIERLED